MRKLVVLGAGESGTGAALLGRAKGYQVFVSDKNIIADKYKQQLLNYNIAFEEGNHNWENIKQADEVIKSPGISNNTPIVQAIGQADIPLIAEVEFASRYTDALLIGITGSNGKSTTTHLVYHLLQSAGYRVGIAGNMGQSFAKQILSQKHDYYVLELSSFQLEHIHSLRLHIACILNITPDHLDRYENQLESYIKAKFRILNNMNSEDYFIYNKDDEHIRTHLEQISQQPNFYSVSLTERTTQGAYVAQDRLYFTGYNYSFQIPVQLLPLLGKHNKYNAMTAITVANLIGISPASTIMGLKTFKGLPHRMEWIGAINQVDFYNDSKATNIDSAAVALESFTKPIIWIAGGYDKGNNYDLLKLLVKSNIKAIICLGKDNSPLFKAFEELNKPMYEVKNMQETVNLALEIAQPHDIVLLSPACASFDLFRNFEDRGEQFKQIVQQAFNLANN